jgi:transcription elongation factor Elf1
MKRLLALVVCRIAGHRRGRFHSPIRDQQERVIARMFICPRCQSTWQRAAKKVAP